MNKRDSKRLRQMKQEPRYYRNRAIEMGEMYGVWSAEFELGRKGSFEKMRRYLRRMLWYTQKANRHEVQVQNL